MEKGRSCDRPFRVSVRGAAQPRFTFQSERMLPERTIRQGNATVETTRHWITSFQFVEHHLDMGQLQCGCKRWLRHLPLLVLAVVDEVIDDGGVGEG